MGFVFITVFTCDPISAFWDQTDLILNSSGKYKYKCLDEGAAIVANGAISALQVKFSTLYCPDTSTNHFDRT